MYEYIKGIYKGINKDYIIIENNNMGYKVYTSGTTMAALPSVEENVTLYLKLITREDFMGLYGFLTREELHMFELLLNVSGVGAKAALSLLSISSVKNLKYAILIEDEKFIVRAPGIGKKTSQRIILEVKDKLAKEDQLNKNEINSLAENDINNNYSEALGALISLGYSEKEAEKALKEVKKDDSLENIIKNSLKVLMK